MRLRRFSILFLFSRSTHHRILPSANEGAYKLPSKIRAALCIVRSTGFLYCLLFTFLYLPISFFASHTQLSSAFGSAQLNSAQQRRALPCPAVRCCAALCRVLWCIFRTYQVSSKNRTRHRYYTRYERITLYITLHSQFSSAQASSSRFSTASFNLVLMPTRFGSFLLICHLLFYLLLFFGFWKLNSFLIHRFPQFWFLPTQFWSFFSLFLYSSSFGMFSVCGS